MGRGPKSTKGNAKPGVSRKSQKDEDSKVRDLERRLAEAREREAEASKREAEALERETAASEILRIISSSPADVQPVLDAVAESAARLCAAYDAIILRLEGDGLHVVAHHGPIGHWGRLVVPALRGTVTGRTVLDRQTVQVTDLQAEVEEFPEGSALAREFGHRTVLSVPLLREGGAIGSIALRRTEVQSFTEKQIALLKTFADQAVIAIENVRLFTELQEKNRALNEAHTQVTEALDQQTATSEILRVIASSPTDVRPVFEAILKRAATLCEAQRGHLWLYEGGEQFRLGAGYGSRPDHLQWLQQGLHRIGRPFFRESGPWRVGQVLDVRDTEPYRRGEPLWIRTVDHEGMRTLLAVPLVKDGCLVGSIAVYRREVQPFTDQQTALVQTFADQAVIAIENVRLFKELETRNHDLTTALNQQTATSEILKVISSSPTDAQPVFEAIVRSAQRLSGAYSSSLTRLVDGELQLTASSSTTPSGDVAVRAFFPLRLTQAPLLAQAIDKREPLIIEDTEADPRITLLAREIARQRGYRSTLQLPLVHGDRVIGMIAVSHAQPRAFTRDDIELLRTFANQAVIAIENVRLFTELESRNRDLTATSEILQVISRSPTDVQPVFETIVDNAHRLFRSVGTVVLRYDGDFLSPAALRVSAETREWVPRLFPMRPSPDSAAGRCVLTRAAVHVADYETPDAPAGVRDVAKAGGWRSALAVPMFRDEQIIGAIFVSRATPGAFADREIALLKTFADQAVIAIENVRLFKELEARTQDLTRSVGELQALGEVGQAISSTLDFQTVLTTIVSRATDLAGMDAGVIYEYDEEREIFEPRATERLAQDIVRALVATPIRKGEGATGQLAEVREPIQVADVRDRAQAFQAREVLVRAGYRAALAVPLVRENRLFGGLTVFRKSPGEFAPEVVDLLRTFATQSALAIQNARLFREIEDKGRQLEVASQHKSEFLANMSHELRTPLNAIIGFSEVLTDRMFGELNEKQEEYLKDIYASGTHLLSLINDILDLSKIEAGRMELELTDFDLPTAIENALMLVRERAGRRSLTLQTNIDERLGQIQADERKVRQVVLNLLSNAIKFTPEGGRIDVSAVPKDGLVEVSVSDTGIGIAPEDQEKVFEEFRQVGTAAKKIEGTGLGLTLCRKFVELHGGKIWVKSQVGEGSTFTFTIPVRR